MNPRSGWVTRSSPKRLRIYTFIHLYIKIVYLDANMVVFHVYKMAILNLESARNNDTNLTPKNKRAKDLTPFLYA